MFKHLTELLSVYLDPRSRTITISHDADAEGVTSLCGILEVSHAQAVAMRDGAAEYIEKKWPGLTKLPVPAGDQAEPSENE